MKYFEIIDKNVAAIFQLQWKIGNISIIISDQSSREVHVKKMTYHDSYWLDRFKNHYDFSKLNLCTLNCIEECQTFRRPPTLVVKAYYFCS